MLFPRPIRNYMLRSRVLVDRAPSSALQLKLAQGKEELEEAYRLLHNMYVSQGLMQPQSSGMRITKYNALPSTSTLIAKYDGKVVGTVSVIRDSSFGFPLEKTFDVSFLSKNGGRIAEISSLAIHPDFEKRQGEVLFPLIKYMYEYCERYFGVDYMVIAAPEDHFPLYEGVLFFRKLKLRATAENDLLKTNPCTGGYLHLRTAYKLFEEHYGEKAPERNLFTYFTALKLPNFIFPERRFKTISDPVLTADLFNYFFNERTNMAKVLTEQERRILWRLYENPAFRLVLPRPTGGGSRGEDRRTQARFEVKCDGKAHFVDGNRRVHMDIRDVSDHGFQAILDAPIRFGTPMRVDLSISDDDVVTLKVFPVWVKGENTYGFRIQEAGEAWQRFLAHLTTDLRKAAA